MTSFTLDIYRGVFTWIDYTLFIVVILISCSGGLWYSATGTKNANIKDIKDYLLGGKHMATFPVSLSLIASYFSGVTMLGTPTEIFNYGLQYGLVMIPIMCAGLTVMFVYVPVFHSLNLSSSYEYLELRFNKYVRAAVSLLFLFDEILFLPMIIYVPALAFQQLTGINVYIVAGTMVLVCGLYTVLGGLRAVVWTDSIQTGVMYAGMVITAVVGVMYAGGFSKVWRVGVDSGRINLSNWSLSPYERQSGWAVLIGQYIYWTCFNSVNQTMVQRYLALPSIKKTRIAILLFCMGAFFAVILCVWTGLTAWAVWVQTGCDERAKPLIDDRLLPAFVTFIAHEKNMKGFPGVFLAGVFGAGLSSLSAVLNACALVGVEDLCRGALQLRLKPVHEGLLARGISTALAIIAIFMILVIEKLGGILSVMTTLSAIAASTSCGVFSLGMFFWWVGPKGALVGAVVGSIVAGTLAAGSSAASAAGYKFPPVPIPNGVCDPSRNVTFVPGLSPDEVFPPFRLSYHWIAPLGLSTTLIAGAIGGFLLDRDMPPINPAFMSQYVHRWLPDKSWQLSPLLSRRRHAGVGERASGQSLLMLDRRLSHDRVSHSGRISRSGSRTMPGSQTRHVGLALPRTQTPSPPPSPPPPHTTPAPPNSPSTPQSRSGGAPSQSPSGAPSQSPSNASGKR